MKIGIDIDGIILDFERTMRAYAELYDLLILEKKGVINQEEFDYLKRYDWTDEERRNFIDNHLVYATINSTPLIPLVKEMLDFFTVEGYEFEFITARGMLKEETKEAVIQVFKKNGLPVESICWGVKDKVQKCLELGITLMLEDNPNTCKLLKKAKIKTIYFRDKDNEKLKEDEYLKEVSNVGEICRYMIDMNGPMNNKETYEKILIKNLYKNK